MTFSSYNRLARTLCVTLALAGVFLTGCRYSSDSTSTSAEAAPRPVNVLMIRKGYTPSRNRVSATVAPWKQERIGFQVAGRVRQVIETGSEIQGRVYDGSGEQLLSAGTVVAQLDDERFEVAVQSALAAVDVATRKKESVQVDIEARFPARIQSQKAELSLALGEWERTKSLAAQNAISDSEMERVRTAYETALADESVILAEQKAREAEVRSLSADILRAESALSEAQLNLRDAKLYSSFRGQVADVHVAPGSYVNEGDPVVTVQMMDPIKVEFEVSAEDARHYHYADTLKVITGSNGSAVELPGFVLMTDPVADPLTRTFTVSLLVRNEPKRTPVPEALQSSVVARTHDVWPVRIEPLIGVGPTFMMEESAIRQDSEGAFIWRITNRQTYEVRSYTPELQVVKTRVTVGDQQVPFLNWIFVPIHFASELDFDPERAMFAGDLTVNEGSKEDWDGNLILFDDENWNLRPGDTVQVEREADEPQDAFYVPAKAIARDGGKDYVYVVSEQGNAKFARRVEIAAIHNAHVQSKGSTLVAIEAVSEPLPETLALIIEGVHYLVDGDAIAIADRKEASL